MNAQEALGLIAPMFELMDFGKNAIHLYSDERQEGISLFLSNDCQVMRAIVSAYRPRILEYQRAAHLSACLPGLPVHVLADFRYSWKDGRTVGLDRKKPPKPDKAKETRP